MRVANFRFSFLTFVLLLLRGCPMPAPAQPTWITNSTPERAMTASNLVNRLNSNFALLYEQFSGRTDRTNGTSTNTLTLSGTNRVKAAHGVLYRSLEARFAEVVNVLDFGATGDGVTDDTEAFQAAIDYAQSQHKALAMPDGTYVVGSLTVAANSYFKMVGGSMKGTILKCAAGNPGNFLTIGDSSAQSTWYEFRSFTIDGNSVAAKGIYGSRVDHGIFDHVRIVGTLTVACDVGYGWNNTFSFCEIAENSGDGLKFNVDYASGGNNACSVHATYIFNNGGFGVDAQSSLKLAFTGCILEQNKKGGALLRYGNNSFSFVDGYTEANGETGYTFTSPVSVTVRADFILNGGTTATTLERSFPNYAVDISGNTVSDRSDGVFIFAIAVDGLDVKNNTCNESPTVSVVQVACNSDYARVSDLRLRGNKRFTDPQVQLYGNAATKPAALSTWNIDGTVAKNYLTLSPFDYVSTGLTGRLCRGDQSYNGYDTLRIDQSASGDTDFFVKQLDLDNYPELTNRPVYVGAWVKLGSTNMNATAYVSGVGESADFAINNGTTWHWIEMQRTLPDTGVISFGFRRLGGGTNSVWISRPVLSLAGVSRDCYWREPVRTYFASSAAPTAGYFGQNEIVWRTSAVEGDGVGWLCTASGSPGTFLPLAPVRGSDNSLTLSGTSATGLQALMLQNSNNSSSNATAVALWKVNNGAAGLKASQAANVAGPVWSVGNYDARIETGQSGAYLHFMGGDGSNTNDVRIDGSGVLSTAALGLRSLPNYANNAAAVAGGLAVGRVYRTGGDPDVVCVVH